MLAVAIIIACVIAVAVGFSVGYMVRDMRGLHRHGKHLTDTPMDADGVSPAGMGFFGQIGSH
jgi:hypothetical protein